MSRQAPTSRMIRLLRPFRHLLLPLGLLACSLVWINAGMPLPDLYRLERLPHDYAGTLLVIRIAVYSFALWFFPHWAGVPESKLMRVRVLVVLVVLLPFELLRLLTL